MSRVCGLNSDKEVVKRAATRKSKNASGWGVIIPRMKNRKLLINCMPCPFVVISLKWMVELGSSHAPTDYFLQIGVPNCKFMLENYSKGHNWITHSQIQAQ